MSTFKVTISIEVDGLITDNGDPKTLSFQHDHHTGDNPLWYATELRRATGQATAKVMSVMDTFASGAPSTPDTRTEA